MSLRLSIWIGCLAAAAAFTAGSYGWSQAGQEPATLVLRGGKVATVDPANPEAQAVAVRGDRIVAVGSNAEIQAYIGEQTEVIELGGRLVTPGFIDTHVHFGGLGSSLVGLRLNDAQTWDEVVAIVAAAAREAQPGEWIVGRGWHQEKWNPPPEVTFRGFPTHHKLSEATPDNPVYLTHASGHGAFADALAMELSGITRDRPDPSGGEIVRDDEGNPTGALVQAASGLVRVGRRAGGPRANTFDLATEECLRWGVTSIHETGGSFGTAENYKRRVDAGEMRIRIYSMPRVGAAEIRRRAATGEWPLINYGDHRLTARGIKAGIDGALGTRGAWLIEPYEDAPDTTGHGRSVNALRQTAQACIETGFQLTVHAIGDRGNRETLNIFEEAFRQHPDKTDPRWRIEHAQHIDPADVRRFRELGVVASMQGIHCTSDGPWVFPRLGHQRAGATSYLWRSLLEAGVVVTNGTDAPVEDINSIASYYATVTRRMPNGEYFFPEQRMTRAEALHSYTMAGAYAAFEEEIKGSLTPGKLADLVVWSQDLLTIPNEQILNTEAVYTVVGGKVEYRASEDPERDREPVFRVRAADGSCCDV